MYAHKANLVLPLEAPNVIHVLLENTNLKQERRLVLMFLKQMWVKTGRSCNNIVRLQAPLTYPQSPKAAKGVPNDHMLVLFTR
jgi:hypothetical protein